MDGLVSSECDPLVLTSLDPNEPALIKNTNNTITVKIEDRLNPRWGEAVHIGTAASQDPNDNTNYVWIEGNEIYETGYGEVVDLKGGLVRVVSGLFS